MEGGDGIDWASCADARAADEMGLIPRAMQMLWRVAEAQRTLGWTYTFEASLVEVYLDQVSDLLSDASHCEVKHMPTHTHVERARIVPMTCPDDVYALLLRAKQRRRVAATKMNDRSSRSHSVFALRVQGRHADGDTTDATLNLVDLAGSERLASSGAAADAQRLKETQSINKSLSSITDVISALATHAKHVPYRNSTLTWLLKPSLSRGSKTYVTLLTQPHAPGALAAPDASRRDTVLATVCYAGARHAPWRRVKARAS